MKKIFCTSLVALGLVAASFAAGDSRTPFSMGSRKGDGTPTTVTSDSLEFDYKSWIALFIGNVVVTDPEFVLKADRMILFFENTNDVKRVDCVGNVDMTSDDIRAQCGRATYTRENARIILQDQPMVSKGEQRLTGESISIWLNDERVIAYDRSHRVTTRAALASIAALRAQLGAAQRVALVLDSPYGFALALMAVLSLGQRPVILGHHNPSLLATQHELFDLVLTDLPTLPSLAQTAGLTRPVLEIGSLVREPPALPEDELAATQSALSLIAASSVFELYTSGSTGSPKAVLKTVGEMEAEAQVLAQLLGTELAGATLLATVFPYHMYGLTFSVFLPWSTGTVLYLPQIHYTEELAALPAGRYVLISSPAFLKRLDFKLKAPALSAIVSAGGPLAAEIRLQLKTWSGVSATEIYGSTEAGVMAHRQDVSDEAPFTLFSDVTCEVSPERTILHSGHVATSLTLDDRIELMGARRIKLLGRSDRIVKIEEKRVSLNAIEAALQQLPGISGAAACVVKRDGRDLIGAALVTDQVTAPEPISGKEYLALRRLLTALLEPHALPRILVKIPALPENAMGKRDSRALSELFATNIPRP